MGLLEFMVEGVTTRAARGQMGDDGSWEPLAKRLGERGIEFAQDFKGHVGPTVFLYKPP